MSEEIEWRDIPDYPDYEVSTQGVVRVKSTQVEAETVEIGDSYCYVMLKNGHERIRAVRPIMQMAFPELTAVVKDPITVPELDDDWAEEQKNKLRDALRDELKETPNTYGLYSLNDLIASKMVERVIKEGWVPK